MIALFLLSLFISSSAFSFCVESLSNDPAIKEISTMLSQECIKPFNTFQLNDALKNEKDSPEVMEMRKKICKPCLEKNILKSPDVEQAKQRMTKLLISETKKNLSQTMLDLMSIRSIGLESNPTSAIISCDFNKYIQNITSCLSKTNIGSVTKDFATSELGKMKDQARIEFFNLISPKEKIKTDGLLPRNDERTCNLSEKDILTLKTNLIEEKLLKRLSALKKLKFEETGFSQQIINAFKNSSGDEDLNLGDLQNHPVLKQIFTNADSLNEFLKNSPENINISSLRKKIYSKENIQKFDSEIANRCSNAFKTLESTFCSVEFAEGNVFFDDSQSIRTLNGIRIDNLSSNHDEKNRSLLLFCQEFSKPGKKINVSEIQKTMNSNLPRPDTYEELSNTIYNEQLADPGQMLCEKICPNKSDKSCPNPQNGKQSNLLSDDLDKHNDGIDQIFRSLLGKPSRDEVTDPVMLAAFEKEGIIRDATGQYVTNEPKSNSQDNTTLASSIQPSQPQPGRQVAISKPTSTVQETTQTDPAPQISYPTNPTPTSNNQPLPLSSSPSSSSSDDETRNDLQKQILDRLGKQVTAKQIEDMVAKAYNQGRSTPMTQAQVEEKTKEVLEDIPSNLGGSSSGENQVNAKISSDPNKAKKAQQLGFLKAKYGIDPTASNSKGSVAKTGAGDENLKVVAVTSADELKIVVGDLKNLKNAQIAELMQKQTPFILQVGNVAYKIAFEKGQLTILPPKNVARDPAAITKLQSYFVNLAKNQNDKSLYKELRSLKYQE